jgi:hypothetical protein
LMFMIFERATFQVHPNLSFLGLPVLHHKTTRTSTGIS